MPDAASNSPAPPRRWTVLAAGSLLLALAVVVIYTSRRAFNSPLALVVIAAIGLAALLLQLRIRKDKELRVPVRSPLWLNILGLAFSAVAIVADFLRLSANTMLFSSLGAVACFAVSGVIVLRALRAQK